MSLITYWISNVNRPATFGLASAGFSIAKIVNPTRQAIAKSGRLFVRTIDALAAARMHRAMIEIELHRNMCKISSKNDDDLPVVRPARPKQ